jgi:hypothetical protein
LLFAIEAKKKLFSSLERIVFSFGLSIVVTDFLMIIMGRVGILLTRFSIILGILVFSLVCFAIYKIIKGKAHSRIADESEGKNNQEHIFNFSKNQIILIMILLFLTVFIKTAYLRNSILPTSTDLGHHMYWAKLISETGKLPIYRESDIIQVNGNYQVGPPQKIADFIIGEHLFFSAINLISGINFISYFPSLILLLVDMAGILAIFILTLRFFEDYSFGKNSAILSLLFMGPLYAISSSQAKFVSGGVIGNLIGDLLIPFALYFLFRAFKEKNATFISLAIFSALGLAYIHHLSAFIFLFIFAFTAIIFFIFNFNNIGSYFKDWLKIILKPQVIILLIFSFLLFIFVYTPTYVDTKAIGTAVGGPSKDTRAGLTFNQLKMTAGEARMALGLIGIIILLSIKKRKSYGNVFILGWSLSIILMSLYPQWLFLNLPSTRIANYVSFPLAISAAFSLAWTFEKIKKSISPKILFPLILLFAAFIITNGFYDNSQSLNVQSNRAKAIQTFNASDYAASKASGSDLVLKDHNYITADSWIKLSFMDGYNYPFSRGYFKRYEDATNSREMCTLQMISTPNTPEGQKCFSDLGVDFVMVNPQFDSAQFQKSSEFWQVYTGDNIVIYYKSSR